MTTAESIAKVAHMTDRGHKSHSNYIGSFGVNLSIEVIDNNAVMIAYDSKNWNTPWDKTLTPGRTIFNKLQSILAARGIVYNRVEIDYDTVVYYF